MRCTITIDMDNAAFADSENNGGGELARILADLARRMSDESCYAGLGMIAWDVNGNRVGYLEISEGR